MSILQIVAYKDSVFESFSELRHPLTFNRALAYDALQPSELFNPN